MPPAMLLGLIVLAAASAGMSVAQDGAKAPVQATGTAPSSRRMPEGNEWTTANLTVDTAGSYCYSDRDLNCRRYGRLYTWDAAQRGCRSLGAGWRLPTEEEWRRLAKHFGGVAEDADDGGKAAYKSLLAGGDAGFDAVLGGGREPTGGQYGRLEAHGFYWTATESGPGSAWFYNFARGRVSLYRQREGEKERAFSVRCIRD